MVVAVTAYGMATFEGPMLAIKSINALSHYTDWTVAHVHVGALGWNGFLTFSVLYWLIPKIYNTELYSKRLANAHFALGLLQAIRDRIPESIAEYKLVANRFSKASLAPCALLSKDICSEI